MRNAKKKQRRQQQQSFGLLAFRNAKRDADVKSSAATHSGATHSTSSSSSAAAEDYAANFSWDEDESELSDEMEIISEGDEEAEDEDMGEKGASGGQ